MKTNHFIKFAALLLLCCAMLGCEKQNVEPEPEMVTKIYGTVFDKDSGEPVQGAEVVFGMYNTYPYTSTPWKRISSSISGDDGQYEMTFGELPKLNSSEVYQIRIDFHYNVNHFSIEIIEGYSHKLDFNVIPY